MKRPNLFIVGAPKAGTTFLYQKLKDHPDLFFPTIKELNYFSFDELISLSYYKDYKIGKLNKYENFYSEARTQKYLVDGSVSYFAFNKTADKIKKYNSEAKIIIILRDPVERAYSHYLMDKRMGYAKHSINEYINENELFHAHHLQYIGNSNYKRNIEVYLKVFKPENVFIMKLESLKIDFDKLISFLNIDKISVETNDKVNENKEANNKLARFFQKNRNVTERIKRFIPVSLIKWANKRLYSRVGKAEMSVNDRLLLEKELAEDIIYYNSL